MLVLIKQDIAEVSILVRPTVRAVSKNIKEKLGNIRSQ